MTAKSRKSRGRRRTANQLTTLLLVLPLVVFYEIGALFSSHMNGADFVTQNLLRLVGLKGFVGVQIGLLVALAALALYLRRTQRIELNVFLPVLLESGIYALTMGTLILVLMTDLLGIDPRLGPSLASAGLLDKLVLSVGAGVYEELVFRLLLLGGLVWLGERGLGLKRGIAVTIALLVSALLFAAAHHVGPLGEPLRLGVLTYRTLAGLFFGALFLFRGFAIAVYTHALYDVYVLVVT